MTVIKQYNTTTSTWEPIVSGVQGPTGASGGFPSSSTAGFVGIPNFFLGATGTQALNASQIYYNPYVWNSAVTLNEVGIRVTTASTAGGLIRIALYNADSNYSATTLVQDFGTVAVDSTGWKSITGLSLVLPIGNYTMRIHTDASATQATIAALRGSPTYTNFLNKANDQFYYQQQASRTFGVAETPAQAVAMGTPSGTTTTAALFYWTRCRWSA